MSNIYFFISELEIEIVMLKITRRMNSTISGLNSRLSIFAKSRNEAPITLKSLDVIKNPSSDISFWKFDELESWVQQRRLDINLIFTQGRVIK